MSTPSVSLSSMFKKLREIFMINPNHIESIVRTKTFRYPSPGSQPQYSAPDGEGSDIANNPYFKRDSRKHSPKTIHVTKKLIGEGTAVDAMSIVAYPPPLNGSVHHYKVSPNQPPHDEKDYFPIVNYK